MRHKPSHHVKVAVHGKGVHTLPCYSLILSSHLGIHIHSNLFILSDKIFICVYYFSHSCFIPYPSHPPWFHHSTNIQLIVHFFPSSCYFPRTIFKHRSPLGLETKSYTHTNNSQRIRRDLAFNLDIQYRNISYVITWLAVIRNRESPGFSFSPETGYFTWGSSWFPHSLLVNSGIQPRMLPFVLFPIHSSLIIRRLGVKQSEPQTASLTN
jgi:hypothetical protein